jgi:Ca2+/Na+ antiporter
MTASDEPRPCEEGGGGQALPSWHEFEDVKFKVVLYGIGLCYSFLGVSIVADMFMCSIERITSRKRVIQLANGRTITSKVWNDSVANLTLMALGSSAPEILLSLNDIFKNEYFESQLGPSTIVGSAAFNLFVIIAVCINSVPDGETRRIKEMGVFVITAVFSLFAYLWLLIIVQINSKDIISVEEGVITFMYFPLLVIISYAADVGWLSRVPLVGKLFAHDGDDDGIEVPDAESEGDSDPLSFLLRCMCWPCLCICRCCKRMFGRHANDDDHEAVTSSDDAEMAIDHTLPIVDIDGNPLKNEFGIVSFAGDRLQVLGEDEEKEVTIPIYRKNGTSGRVSVKWCIERLTATPGYDYVDASGELHFRDGIESSEIAITILPKQVGEKADRFQVLLQEATGGMTFNPYSDGGKELNILTVTINNGAKGSLKAKQRLYRMLDQVVNLDEVYLGTNQWYEQVLAAVYVNGSREEQDTANFLDWVVHLINFPWKFPFALTTPPPTYLGGWVCFFFSLGHIAWITLIIGDLAELFGCNADISDNITAVTFVALGTSVPDLLASRIAAKAEEHADASIVNVTGSNSVNVFLGIGLPWMVAAFYWKTKGPNQKWIQRYPEHHANDVRAFIVTSGDLAFSVTVFVMCAMVCLSVILVRRYKFGGELGGHPEMKAYSSFMLMLLWAFYIALTIWKTNAGDVGIWQQSLALGLAMPVFVFIMFLFAACRKALLISKKYIGEEGFWGIFVATGIIGGRLLIYGVFQYSPS